MRSQRIVPHLLIIGAIVPAVFWLESSAGSGI